MTTTHHDILKLIRAERTGSDREHLLEVLCTAYVLAYDDEVDEEQHEHDHDVLNDSAAHLYYCAQYDRGGTGGEPYTGALGPDGLPLTEVSEQREVSVPAWAPNHRRLLRALARDERKADEAMLTYCRAHLARTAATKEKTDAL